MLRQLLYAALLAHFQPSRFASHRNFLNHKPFETAGKGTSVCSLAQNTLKGPCPQKNACPRGFCCVVIPGSMVTSQLLLAQFHTHASRPLANLLTCTSNNASQVGDKYLREVAPAMGITQAAECKSDRKDKNKVVLGNACTPIRPGCRCVDQVYIKVGCMRSPTHTSMRSRLAFLGRCESKRNCTRLFGVLPKIPSFL